MILPLGDMPNPPGFRAWVTWALIAANVLVYLLWTLPASMMPADPTDPAVQELVRRIARQLPAGVDPAAVLPQLSAWDAAIQRWGYIADAPEAADLFAAMFMHANLAHLGGNMLFLWIYGDNAEHRLGRLPFLAAYLGSGALATLAYAALAGGSTPLVGASGAISGVLGLYFVFFPHNQVRLLVVLFPFLVRTFLVPAPVVLGAYVLLDNLLPLLIGAGGSVAYGAHLGGFVAGTAIAVAVGRVPRRRTPQPTDDPVRLARAVADAGRPGDGYVLLQRAIAAAPDPVEAARLHVGAARLLQQWGQVSLAYQHIVAALRLARRRSRTREDAEAILRRLPIDPRLVDRLLGDR